MGFIESFELRTVRTTGGIFKTEDFDIFQKVAEGLETVGEHITFTIGANVDDIGRLLNPDQVRIIISSPGRLENFWRVADRARKYRKSLAEEESVSDRGKADKLDKFITQTIQSLPHQTRGRE